MLDASNLSLSKVTIYGSTNHPATSTTNHHDHGRHCPPNQYDVLCYGDNDDSSQSNDTNPTSSKYTVYFQRWIVLFVFSVLSFVNSWLWITWSPFTLQVANYWNVSSARVDDLSAVYMYVYIPLSFPALYSLHVYKLRIGLLLGGGLNLLGAVLKYWGMSSYPWVYTGTVVCAMCQTLTLAMPPLISTLWFPDQERGMATSLGVLANQLGAAMGLGITIFVPFRTIVVQDASDSSGEAAVTVMDSDQLKRYLRCQMFLSVFSFLLILVLVRSDQPPTPPSEAAHRSHPQQEHWNSTAPTTASYWQSIHLLLSTTSGSILCVVYGLTLGVLYTLATFLAQVFSYGPPSSQNAAWGGDLLWTEAEIGYLGATLILAGVIGAIVSGDYLDRTQQQSQSHRRVSIVLLVGSLVAMTLFDFSRAVLPLHRCLAYLATGLVGCFITGFMSVGFEYGTAISYPADEAAVAGVMNVAAQIGGWILVAIGGSMMTPARRSVDASSSIADSPTLDEEQSIMVSRFITVMVGALVVALLLLWTAVKAKSQRPKTSK
jgi:MFS transporter, FLVCR family, feline leukemia virus subgroup C receptor-related protein